MRTKPIRPALAVLGLLLLPSCSDGEQTEIPDHTHLYTQDDIDTDTDIVSTGTGTGTEVDTTIGTQIMFWAIASPYGGIGGYALQQPTGTSCAEVQLLPDDDGTPRLLPNGSAQVGQTAKGATISGDAADNAAFYVYEVICPQLNWDVSGNSCIVGERYGGTGVVFVSDPYSLRLESPVWTQNGEVIHCG